MRRGSTILHSAVTLTLLTPIDITPEIAVYRYSNETVIELLKVKVTRLVTPEVFEASKTLIRGLAKDGLMEDDKEDLLTGESEVEHLRGTSRDMLICALW